MNVKFPLLFEGNASFLGSNVRMLHIIVNGLPACIQAHTQPTMSTLFPQEQTNATALMP